MPRWIRGGTPPGDVFHLAHRSCLNCKGWKELFQGTMFSKENAGRAAPLGAARPFDVRRRSGGGGSTGSLDVLVAEVVQDLEAHPVPMGQGEHSDGGGVPLGTQPQLRVDAERIACPCSPIFLYPTLVGHPFTPPGESMSSGRKNMKKGISKVFGGGEGDCPVAGRQGALRMGRSHLPGRPQGSLGCRPLSKPQKIPCAAFLFHI